MMYFARRRRATIKNDPDEVKGCDQEGRVWNHRRGNKSYFPFQGALQNHGVLS